MQSMSIDLFHRLQIGDIIRQTHQKTRFTVIAKFLQGEKIAIQHYSTINGDTLRKWLLLNDTDMEATEISDIQELHRGDIVRHKTSEDEYVIAFIEENRVHASCIRMIYEASARSWSLVTTAEVREIP